MCQLDLGTDSGCKDGQPTADLDAVIIVRYQEDAMVEGEHYGLALHYR